MKKPLFRLASTWFGLALLLGMNTAHAEKKIILESRHYRVIFDKKYMSVGEEVLRVAESVWPTLAKAYHSYDQYEQIEIRIIDEGDDANGYAIYPFSSVAIFAPHMDWVMRNRQTWIQNVVTHELAHIFTLRRAAYLSPIDGFNIYGSTYNYTDRINFSFTLPWTPLVAPTWYVEGIAQFEAAQNGNDTWDSQRDMILRDEYLTGTLPELDFIETFQSDEGWTQGERVYNTGYAFLLYLKDRFGVDKVRALADPKPFGNFSYSVEKAFGRELTVLYEDFKRSLTDRYADFKSIPTDSIADKDMVGNTHQDLAFSSDGRYMAWLGNDQYRRAPLNWIFWKEIKTGKTTRSGKPDNVGEEGTKSTNPGLVGSASSPNLKANYLPRSLDMDMGNQGDFIRQRLANPSLGLTRNSMPHISKSLNRNSSFTKPSYIPPEIDRSDEIGSSGLEFNHDNTRLLTMRQDRHGTYNDIWEYEFKSNKSEEDKWHRLTWEERASYPSYHPTKNLIIYTRKISGSSNLSLLDSTGRSFLITNFSNGEQVYNPKFNARGDSIYFTYGFLDKESIASISASAPGFSTLLSLKDSAEFPDSLNLGKSQNFNFITPMKKGAIRNIHLAGDTLYWSSNSEDSVYSVYDIYAKIPNDSAVYRATHVSGQALQALPHGGNLYYQGYRKQQFLIFKQPLSLTRTSEILHPKIDSILSKKPKADDLSGLIDTINNYGSKVAQEIMPYLAVQPMFLSGDKSYTDLALGLSLTLGESYGGWMQSFSGAVTKRADIDNPMSYQVSYSGYLSEQPFRHTRFTWLPTLYYSAYHDVVQNSEHFVEKNNYVDPVSGDLLTGVFTTNVHSNFSRDALSAQIPIPSPFFPEYSGFMFDVNFWRQIISQDFSQSSVVSNITKGGVQTQKQPSLNFLKDANQHRHINSGLTWSVSRGMVGTFLPTGAGLYLSLHKWWATYETGEFSRLDSSNVIRLISEGKIVPEGLLPQAEFEPWSFENGVSGIWSAGREFSVFANAEMGMFLNKAPTYTNTTPVNSGGDSANVENLENGMWAMTYRIGYYRMSGYPYNFQYRGRDIMEGSSFTFGQAGIQIPIKAGLFLPSLPTTSFQKFLITAMGEWGTTQVSAPDKVVSNLAEGKHYLLLDYGLRFSMNFQLYHQYPFTIFAQVFEPFNLLTAENLFYGDYPHTSSNDSENRTQYINRVKDPRFFVGFNLGTF